MLPAWITEPLSQSANSFSEAAMSSKSSSNLKGSFERASSSKTARRAPGRTFVAQLSPQYIRRRPLKAVSRLVSYALFEGRPITTKGRWINPLVFSLFSLEARLPQLRRVRKPIFVMSTGRTGTTALGLVLSMHREVAFLNEPKALWYFCCPAEDLIGNYAKTGIGTYLLDSRHVSQAVRLRAHHLYGAYLMATCSQRVVDKSEWTFRVPFLREIFPDARFLFLTRSGWDACQSVAKWSRRHGTVVDGEVHDWWGIESRKWRALTEQVVSRDPLFSDLVAEIGALEDPLDRAVVDWAVTMREGLRLARQFPDVIKVVRYEDLTHRPRAVLESILEFCELPPDPSCLDYGGEVLVPTPSHGTFEMNPRLLPLFEHTMKYTGYD